MLKRSITYLAVAAMVLIVGPCASAFASTLTVRALGDYGEKIARFQVEQTYMADASERQTAVRSDLRREGHGFRLASAQDLERTFTV